MVEVIKKRSIVANGKDIELTTLYTFISQNIDTIYTLVFFAASLAAFPLLTFFLTLHSLFDGNTTHATGASGVMASFIILIFIIMTWSTKQAKTKAE